MMWFQLILYDILVETQIIFFVYISICELINKELLGNKLIQKVVKKTLELVRLWNWIRVIVKKKSNTLLSFT